MLQPCTHIIFKYVFSQYLLQKSRESRFAERLKKLFDSVEIDARDLWVGFEVGIITVKANKHRIMSQLTMMSQ